MTLSVGVITTGRAGVGLDRTAGSNSRAVASSVRMSRALASESFLLLECSHGFRYPNCSNGTLTTDLPDVEVFYPYDPVTFGTRERLCL
jgi:hypothetical protein